MNKGREGARLTGAWGAIREYYCPGCGGQQAVEVVPPGYPLIFEILPDLDAFYRELGRPLSEQGSGGTMRLRIRTGAGT